MARLDVIKARVDVAQARNDLIANERDISNAERALNRLLGRPGSGLVPSTRWTRRASPSRPPIDDLDKLAETPAELGPRRAGAGQHRAHPRVLDAGPLHRRLARHASPGSPLYTAGIAFPIPILFWQHTRGEMAEAQQHERELRPPRRTWPRVGAGGA